MGPLENWTFTAGPPDAEAADADIDWVGAAAEDPDADADWVGAAAEAPDVETGMIDPPTHGHIEGCSSLRASYPLLPFRLTGGASPSQPDPLADGALIRAQGHIEVMTEAEAEGVIERGGAVAAGAEAPETNDPLMQGHMD